MAVHQYEEKTADKGKNIFISRLILVFDKNVFNKTRSSSFPLRKFYLYEKLKR